MKTPPTDAELVDQQQALVEENSRLHEAIAHARVWHEAEDKALSKSGRSDREYRWRRGQHREQIDAIKAVQSEDEYNRVWDDINARAPADED